MRRASPFLPLLGLTLAGSAGAGEFQDDDGPGGLGAPLRGSIRVASGASLSREPETGRRTAFDVGVDGAWYPAPAWSVFGAFAYRGHDQGYLSRNPGVDGSIGAPVVVEEGEFRWRIGGGADLTSLIAPGRPVDETLDARLGISLTGLHLVNEAFRGTGYGPRFSMDTVVRPVETFSVLGGIGVAPVWGPEEETLSVLGRPVAVLDAGVGVGLAFGEDLRFGIDLGWNHDSIFFDHTVRNADGAHLGVQAIF
jgi:hypothetical protein